MTNMAISTGSSRRTRSCRLWRALSPSTAGRVGAGVLALLGVTLFLEGFFNLDCQGIDAACENTSWQSEGHRWVSRLTGASIFIAPIVLAIAFRRLPQWRDTWVATAAAVPFFIAASVVFSLLGDGASARAGAVAWFLWLGFIAFRLLQKSEEDVVSSARPSSTG